MCLRYCSRLKQSGATKEETRIAKKLSKRLGWKNRETVKKYLPLCGLHYHQCVSGKSPEVELKDGLGTAKYNSKMEVIDYPTAVPKDRLPLPASARIRKGLMSSLPSLRSLNDRVPELSFTDHSLGGSGNGLLMDGHPPEDDNDEEIDEESVIEIPGFFRHYDKYESAVAIQPRNDPSCERKKNTVPEIQVVDNVRSILRGFRRWSVFKFLFHSFSVT
jgi:hypothetical protein